MKALFHVHRHIWGKPYTERWTRPKPYYERINFRMPERESFTKTFQDGTCRCGNVKRREIV